MLSSFFSLISKPFVSVAQRFRKFVRWTPTCSTPIHLVRKSDLEEELTDSKPENPAAQFLNFLTSTAKKKQKRQTSFSSDGELNSLQVALAKLNCFAWSQFFLEPLTLVLLDSFFVHIWLFSRQVFVSFEFYYATYFC